VLAIAAIRQADVVDYRIISPGYKVKSLSPIFVRDSSDQFQHEKKNINPEM